MREKITRIELKFLFNFKPKKLLQLFLLIRKMNKIQTNTIFTRIEILIQLLFNFKPKKLLQLFLLIRKVRRGGRRNGRKFGDRVEERGRIKNLT